MSKRLIAAVLAFSVLFNVVRFFEYRVAGGGLSDLRTDVGYVVGYIVGANFVFMSLVPICAMATFNFLGTKCIGCRSSLARP